MAKSEHQGLQISLILCVMFTVVLAITSVVFYKQSEESAKLEKDAKDKMEAATTRANNLQGKLEYVLNIMGQKSLPEAEVELLKSGFASDEEMKSVVEKYETFINTFGAGMPKEKLTYADVAPAVLSAVRGANNSLQQQTEESANLSKELDTTRTSEKARTEVAQKAQQQAEQTLAQEKGKYESDRSDLEKKQKEELDRYNVDRNKMLADIDAEKKKAELLSKDLKVRENTITDQRNTIKEMRDEPFEVADGKVILVNQGANTVWVDLGLADGLRRQTLFSVYDQADNGVTRTERKASIEVTRVLDQHLAEARIVFDEPANPILQGDQIFSPAWRPGKRVRFALAGLIDTDNDMRSDRNFVRSLLAASGGQIDAELHDDGTIEGKIDSGTRYLVLGATPDETTDQKVLAAYSAMKKEAEELGVEVIGVDELLSWLGWYPEARSVALGKNADPSQFKPKPAEGKSPTSVRAAPEFRERKPSDKAKARTGSAFDK